MLPAAEGPRLAATLAAIAAVVLALHLWLAGEVMVPMLGERAAGKSIRRIDVAFVSELQHAAPPVVAPVPAPAPPKPRRAARAAKPAASAPEAPSPAVVVAQVPEPAASAPVPEPAASAAEPVRAAASEPAANAVNAASAANAANAANAASAPVASASAASAPDATAFDWPPSTRLTYTLTGHYRGPVEGQARVEWLRSGSRYQVFVEVNIGPPFAPLLSRRATSEGEITPQGLSPRRYDEETKAVLRDARRSSVALDGDTIRLANGNQLPRPDGVQDSASQFVQLTWLFTTRPEQLQPGKSITVPLALPRRLVPWTYDVLGSETLHTPAGPVAAVHVKPRAPPRDEGRRNDDLTAEMWVAPSLQYLPVRIVIRQDAENFIDLLIERLPQQAQPGR